MKHTQELGEDENTRFGWDKCVCGSLLRCPLVHCGAKIDPGSAYCQHFDRHPVCDRVPQFEVYREFRSMTTEADSARLVETT